MNAYTEEQVREYIRTKCVGKTQREVADEYAVSQSVISLILTGERGISEEVAEKFGFTRRIIFADPGFTLASEQKGIPGA